MGFFGGSIGTIYDNYGGSPGTDQFDFMTGINGALDQNAALAASQSKKGGFGNFLRNFAGYFGDSLTGNPIYAQQMADQAQQQQMEQWYERKRQDELADYEAKKGIDAKYTSPDYAGSIDEFQQAKKLGYLPQNTSYENFLKLKNPGAFVPPSPVTLPYRATIEGTGGGGAQPSQDAIPTVEDGYQYTPGPGGRANQANWKAVGGQSPGSGGFPY